MSSSLALDEPQRMTSIHAGHAGLAHAAVHSQLATEGYVSLTEAAAYTDLSTKTLRRRIADGTLPAFRTGRLIKVRREDLDVLFRLIPNGATR
jgi:excisionase family DNA binding protein